MVHRIAKPPRPLCPPAGPELYGLEAEAALWRPGGEAASSCRSRSLALLPPPPPPYCLPPRRAERGRPLPQERTRERPARSPLPRRRPPARPGEERGDAITGCLGPRNRLSFCPPRVRWNPAADGVGSACRTFRAPCGQPHTPPSPPPLPAWNAVCALLGLWQDSGQCQHWGSPLKQTPERLRC